MQDSQQKQARLGHEATLSALGLHDDFQGDNQPNAICPCVQDQGNTPN